MTALFQIVCSASDAQQAHWPAEETDAAQRLPLQRPGSPRQRQEWLPSGFSRKEPAGQLKRQFDSNRAATSNRHNRWRRFLEAKKASWVAAIGSFGHGDLKVPECTLIGDIRLEGQWQTCLGCQWEPQRRAAVNFCFGLAWLWPKGTKV